MEAMELGVRPRELGVKPMVLGGMPWRPGLGSLKLVKTAWGEVAMSAMLTPLPSAGLET